MSSLRVLVEHLAVSGRRAADALRSTRPTWHATGYGATLALAVFLPLYRLADSVRYRGDAAEYLRLANRISLDRHLFAPLGDRTVGFPLLVRLLRTPLELVASWFDLPWYELVPFVLLGFHAAVCTVAFRKLQSAGWFAAPAWVLGLLIAHPGLVSHTTVLLTDTLAVDLVFLCMAVTAAIVRPKGNEEAWRSIERKALRNGAVLGALVAALVLVRPFSMVGVCGFLAILLPTLLARRRYWPVAGVFLGASCLLVPAACECRSQFGALCLQNPTFAAHAASGSAAVGLDNVRTYWSGKSSQRDGQVLVPSAALTQHVRTACEQDAQSGFPAAAACVVRHPVAFALLLFEKSVALTDARHLTPYLVDRTPRWMQSGLRALGGLTWIGFAATLGLLLQRATAGRSRSRQPSDAPGFWEFAGLCALPLLIFTSHSLMHIEPRYGYVIVPLAWLSLGTWMAHPPSLLGGLRSSLAATHARVADTSAAASTANTASTASTAWVASRLAKSPRWVARMAFVLTSRWTVAALLGVTFFVQVKQWDDADSVQQAIDASFPRLP